MPSISATCTSGSGIANSSARSPRSCSPASGRSNRIAECSSACKEAAGVRVESAHCALLELEVLEDPLELRNLTI